MSFPRDGEIYSENSPANYLYKVIGGTVRTYKTLSNGRRQITASIWLGNCRRTSIYVKAAGARLSRRSFGAQMSSCRAIDRRHRRVRLWRAGCRTDPAGHYLRLALRIRPRRPVGKPAWLRFVGANSKRPQCRRSGSFWCPRAETFAGTGARSRHRLPDGLRGDLGSCAPRRARRKLARADLTAAAKICLRSCMAPACLAFRCASSASS